MWFPKISVRRIYVAGPQPKEKLRQSGLQGMPHLIRKHLNAKGDFAFILRIRNPIIKGILTSNIFIRLHQIN